MLGSCSLSTIHVDGVDAGDLFGRVEAIPREHVIAAVDEHKTWTTLRASTSPRWSRCRWAPTSRRSSATPICAPPTMGLDRATRKDVRPTQAEQAEMERMLAEALDAGFVGMSSQQLLFDKTRRRDLPLAHAAVDLRQAARAAPAQVAAAPRGRVLQSGPDIQNPLNLASQVAQSLGVLRKQAQDQPAVGRRRQVQPVRDPDDGPAGRGW